MIEAGTIISGIITFVAGGGLVSLFTLRQQKESKELNNASVLVNEYKSLLNDYKEESAKAKAEVDALRRELADVKQEIAVMKEKLATTQLLLQSAEVFRCNNLNCPHRIPPLDKDKVADIIDKEEKQ